MMKDLKKVTVVLNSEATMRVMAAKETSIKEDCEKAYHSLTSFLYVRKGNYIHWDMCPGEGKVTEASVRWLKHQIDVAVPCSAAASVKQLLESVGISVVEKLALAEAFAAFVAKVKVAEDFYKLNYTFAQKVSGLFKEEAAV